MLLQKFKEYCKEQFHQLSATNGQLLLAVSGGIDSIVLTDLAYKSGFRFTIAHCNFQLRGEESERDEAFVKSLANKYDKEVLVKQFDTSDYAAWHKLSVQEAARKLRYDWFQEIVDRWQVADKKKGDSLQMTDDIKKQTAVNVSTLNTQPITNYIVTAHHANDNIETLLINICRGTGISGLHGILPKQNNIIRPLLFAKREELQQYALENSLHWVEDSSNTSGKYTRNFFRLHVIPSLKEAFANVEDNLLQNIERFKEAEQLYNQSVLLHKKKLVETKGSELHIPILKLQKTAPRHTVIWELIKDFGFTAAQVSEVEKLTDADNGKYVASLTHRIIKNRNWLIIAPVQTAAAAHIVIEENDKEIVYAGGKLSFKELSTISHQPSTDLNTATLNATHIQYPLLLRKWKQGDYFYPLGMKKKKKLSRFFIDLKLSRTDKEKVWVLEGNKKIVWVVGYRIDERFKITETTKNVLLITKENARP